MWFNFVLKGLILTDLCQTCNFPAMNIAYGYIFEFTAKFVLTYHGHKFARESHCCDKQYVGKESLLMTDCSAKSRVDNLRKKF